MKVIWILLDSFLIAFLLGDVLAVRMGTDKFSERIVS